MMPQPIIIGLNSTVGKSGKDTLCEMLNAERFAFADALKFETSVMLTKDSAERVLIFDAMNNQALKDLPDTSLSIDSLPASVFKGFMVCKYGLANYQTTMPRSPRFWLQQFGMYQRDKDADYWVKRVEADIQDFMEAPDSFTREFIIVTDVRMPNEYELIERLGGFTVRIERSWPEPAIDNQPKHISDTALDGYNMPVIKNHWGMKEHMVEQLKEVLRERGLEI